jgi:uncharacterized damage-inducible protein DinB
MSSEIAANFLDYSIRKLDDMTKCIESCFEKLDDQQVWQRHADHENAIGNLILHLCGNMRQWIMHGVGGKPDVRTRDQEFSAADGFSTAQLLALFKQHIAEASSILATLAHQRLTERISPQGRDVTVLEAIYQVVGHVQQHTGQIILLTKQMTQQDLNLTIPRPRLTASPLH